MYAINLYNLIMLQTNQGSFLDEFVELFLVQFLQVVHLVTLDLSLTLALIDKLLCVLLIQLTYPTAAVVYIYSILFNITCHNNRKQNFRLLK